MWQQLFQQFIAPRQGDEDTRNREYVLNILLLGTLLLSGITLILLLISLAIGNYVSMRIAAVAVMIAAVGGMYYLSRARHFRVAAYLLVAMYLVIAIVVAVRWGVTMPVAVLLFGLVVVLAGILLGERYSLYGAATVVLVVFAIAVADSRGLIHPNWSWTYSPADMGAVVGFSLIFGIIAVVSWLFNYKMEQSLRRAKRAEAALKRQKALLETTVEKRTRQLQIAQFEKVQELYRFAELGQLSTALMHDLANHLTTLTLDIESLEAQNRSRMLQRAKRSMRYIDAMVMRVRDQLRGKDGTHIFSVVSETEAVIAMLRHKAAQANVVLEWQSGDRRKELRCRGDSTRFRQLITNLISNAIDAYPAGPDDAQRRVRVEATLQDDTIRLTVEDWGKGIPSGDRVKLFEPFYSTKKTGMGLGLFISKQIAEEQFGGTVGIEPVQDRTVFFVTLKAYA